MQDAEAYIGLCSGWQKQQNNTDNLGEIIGRTLWLHNSCKLCALPIYHRQLLYSEEWRNILTTLIL